MGSQVDIIVKDGVLFDVVEGKVAAYQREIGTVNNLHECLSYHSLV